jgi:glyoxylase-like metal-dependent hydrolase (beta-lactamase superfamily II)
MVDMNFRVKALRYMHVKGSVPGCSMFFQDKFDQNLKVVGYIFLVRDDRHNIILVETGMGMPPGPHGLKEQLFGDFCVEPGEDTTSLLRKEGLAPEQIDTLILTHLHTDHCWNVSLFPNAKLLFSRRGWEAIQTPRHPALFPDSIYPRSAYKDLKEKAWERVVLMDEQQEILPGIASFWVGGHSACSHAVTIQTQKGLVILTGDITFYYANLEENIPVAYNVNLAECYEGMDRIRSLGGIAVPTHDPEVLKRHPGGVIA